MILELSYQVDYYLNQNHVSIAQLSSRCGVSAKTIEKALSQEEIPLQDMEKICGVLSLSFDDLKSPHDEKLCRMIDAVLNHIPEIARGDYSFIDKEISALPEQDLLRSAAWLAYYCEVLQRKSKPQ